MIWRSCACASLLLLLSAAATSPAIAAEDNANAVLADCGGPDIPASAIDSCLERVRVLDETDPSPQLQSLEAQLEQRESGPRVARRQPRALQDSASAPSSGMAPYSQPTVVESEHSLSPAAAEPDQTRSAAADEPAGDMQDETARGEGQAPAAAGTERPPADIDDDLPPVADPPDADTPSSRSADAGDNPQ